MHKLDVDNPDTDALAAFASWRTGLHVGSTSCTTLLRQVPEITGFCGLVYLLQTLSFSGNASLYR